ncbi:Mitochondrial carrier protein ymc2 [Rhizophlyctis rosea]|uniref:Mitochondrial carrier protein ymc2 n=1 Tax=Rhizophlyctis rosea TaxID=64517 RepID=A0AAD5SK51_9FUNG|nr:Mitochondrial carrier protein ymc2 [Rhizophlyctis rosea]
MASDTKNKASQTAQELFAGSMGGVVQVLVGQPFDTVKVRLQTQSAENPQYSGLSDCVKKTIKNEGFAGFYKGTLTPLIGVGACVSIQFAALEYVKRLFASRNRANGHADPNYLSHGQLFLAGASSGIANSVVSGPVEGIRSRLQVQSGPNAQYSGPWDLVKQATKQCGFGAVYKGQAITMCRESLGYGMYFSSYEWLMQRTMQMEGKRRDQVEMWKQCLFGAMAGYSLWIAAYPVDVVKSKIQTDHFDPAKSRYKSILDCVRKTFARDGIAGFYRGFWVCMLRAGPVNAATFVAYEVTMNMIGR